VGSPVGSLEVVMASVVVESVVAAVVDSPEEEDEDVLVAPPLLVLAALEVPGSPVVEVVAPDESLSEPEPCVSLAEEIASSPQPTTRPRRATTHRCLMLIAIGSRY
jgi:hypothetical protein